MGQKAQKQPKWDKNVKIQVFSQFWVTPGGRLKSGKIKKKLFVLIYVSSNRTVTKMLSFDEIGVCSESFR